jgi:hypothetical protein
MLFSEFLKEGVIITFDFDDTLKINAKDVFGKDFPRDEYIKQLKDYLNSGNNVYIVTSRDNTHENRQDIEDFLSSENLPKLDIHFTNGKLKKDTLLKLDSSLHFDDDIEELKALKSTGINTINTDDGELKAFYKKYFEKLNED